ncbi:hypothetical protein GUJ93_ZPchr0001g31068 [Zizania palustris]|uniref:Endonuclease/exonuclease/phosphatase domain-containing protein n=2 Tax=Zizania palustris TaxID=103762 RepID=A0A8J5RY03_ZIZPA|nr:hypothetical protein GUJ93_ZPchr0001g31068 [Zizania palustris]
MRLALSAFLRRAATMSAYYNRRGSPRPIRGYSARSTPPPHDAGAEIVSGDSHHSAVRAANDSLRRGGGGVCAPPSPYNYGPPLPPPYGYGYGSQQLPDPRYGAVPYNYGLLQQLPPGPQYGYGTPNPYSQGHPQPYWRAPTNAGFPPPNGGFRPGAPQQPPRLAEYRRRWRFAQHRPPRQAEKFKVLSYNILADYLAQEHRFLYGHIPSFILDWNWRKDKLMFEFGLWSPDIMCLQEVDKFTGIELEMANRGYDGMWKTRTGNASDGCAIFWRTARFRLCHKEEIEFNKLGLRDNVAQLSVLESVIPGNVQTESSPTHPQQGKQIVVCNTHILYNPKRGDIKLGQVRTLLDQAYTISKLWNDAPVILCGDFNSTPKSPLYNFILEQKLNLSGHAKSTISGQQTSSPQGLYTGSNTSRLYPPLHMANSREGSIMCRDDHKPHPEARNLMKNSRLASREPTLTDTASDSCLNSKSSKPFGNKVPCFGSTNPDEKELLSTVEDPAKDACTFDAEAHSNTTNGEESTAVDNSSEGCFGIVKNGPVEEANISDFPSAPTTVYDEILQSDSSEILDTSCLVSSHESSGPTYSEEELVGSSKNSSNTLGESPSHVIPEKVTYAEGNDVQSDTQFDTSKDRPDEKEMANGPMSGQNNCTTSESESSCISDSLNFADALHQMSNMRLEEESNTEPTHLTSPVDPLLKTHCAFSDACGKQYTPEAIINKHSDSHSCSDEFGNHSTAFEDNGASIEIHMNSDPSFFQEFLGVNESLLEDEDQLQTTPDGSLSAQQVVTSDKMYYNYDPYRWTPEEIKAATGNEECTFVEHNLKVRSVYTDVEDFEGTKDTNKEPLVTSYNRKFMGTVDYIWASEDLQTVQVLDTFPKEILNQTDGFPTKKWGSDHIALVCELAFTK